MSIISDFIAPYKAYLWAAVAAALICAAGWAVYHERHIGVKEEVAVVQKASAKQEVIEQKAAATAAVSETKASTLYEETNRAPAPAELPIECVRHSPSAVPVQDPGTASGAAAVDQPATNSGDGPEFNPSGPLLERAKQADAQIIYLQARVKLLEKLIADASK